MRDMKYPEWHLVQRKLPVDGDEFGFSQTKRRGNLNYLSVCDAFLGLKKA